MNESGSGKRKSNKKKRENCEHKNPISNSNDNTPPLKYIDTKSHLNHINSSLRRRPQKFLNNI
jgi:hypothetical protein